MDQSRSIKANLDVFNKMNQELTLCGEKLSEQQRCVILLNSLPPVFDSIREIFECSSEKITMKQVLEAIKANDSRLNSDKNDPEAMSARWKLPKGIAKTERVSVLKIPTKERVSNAPPLSGP